MHILQKEILEFGHEYGIDLLIFNNIIFWKTFGATLLIILIDRQISFPEKPTGNTKRVYDLIKSKAGGSGYLVNGVIYAAFINHEDQVFWTIKTLDPRDKIHIIGPMSIITQEMVNNYKRNN